jgi:group I intron endonuclease
MKMKKYNYVYRIKNKILNKHYYGVRGCNVAPKLDLGIKYFSSSSDSDFRNDQKNHPENYKYKIVRICSTRDEADILEIKLQEKFNVGINESFYNRAKRTSTGFSRADVKLSPEHKLKMSEAQTGENNPMYGKNHSDETRKKMSEAKLGEKHPMYGKDFSPEHKQKLSEANKGENNPMFDKEHTPEAKLKMREAKLGVPQEQVECPHCGKIGGKNLMSRYHFDNCKYKEFEESEEDN